MSNRLQRLLTLLVVTFAFACAPNAPPSGTRSMETQERVPESPPDYQPPTLEDGLVPNEHGDLVSTSVLSVQFTLGATQAERQSAIDLVGGKVIGGVNSGGMGWYYVQVEGDGTIETIYEIGAALDVLPQVELAAPYTLLGVADGSRPPVP